MNKKGVLYLIHIPVWIVAIVFVFLIQAQSGQFTKNPFYSISEGILVSAWFLGMFYLYFSLLVPRYLETGKTVSFVLISISILFTSPFIVDGGLTLNRMVFDIPSPHRLTIWGYLGGIFATFVTGGLGTFYRFGMDWFKNLQTKKDLENKNLQSELKTLKSKLNPHFLFNSLNNIDTLIQTNQELASASLSKLSGLLRYVVYDTENEKVLIQKEIENIQKYIELEKIRLVNPDSVVFKNNVTEKILIPPMIFFPFIENGFKHSNLNDIKQSLTISITTENNTIVFSCINTINDKAPKANEGMGLELARKRLDLLYPDAHKLTIEKNKNMFHVNLEIEIPNND